MFAAIDWLLTDSCSLSFPEETLSLALVTKRNNGARRIRDLYVRGIRSFVASEEGFKEAEALGSSFPDLNLLVVPSSLEALQKLVEQHRNRFQIPVTGITGSNGRTVMKEWLHQLLSPECAITYLSRSYSSQIGVPLSV